MRLTCSEDGDIGETGIHLSKVQAIGVGEDEWVCLVGLSALEDGRGMAEGRKKCEGGSERQHLYD